jgi:hypothetical protein
MWKFLLLRCVLVTLDVELDGNITTTTLQCDAANATPCSVAATITITKV